jgi:hypothetical protein
MAKISLLAAALVCASTVPAIKAQELVNGNFEDTKADNPAGWTNWSWAPNKAEPDATQEWVEGQGRDGSAAVRITVRQPGHVGVWCNTQALFRADPGEYELKAWVRIEGETQRQTCRVTAGFFNDQWQSCDKKDAAEKVFALFPTTDWQLLTIPVTVPEDFNRVRIDIELRSVGSILIDDISFKPAGSAEP